MTRFVTTAMDQPEAKITELVDYLTGKRAPANATTGQVRAIARMFQYHPIMKTLADGVPEVDARELVEVATAELATAEPDTIGARALQSLINWLLVGDGGVEEIHSM